MFVGPFYDFERQLFQLRAAGSKIIQDVQDANDVETYYGRSD